MIIATYFLQSKVFKNMTDHETFSNSSIEDVISSHKDSLRDNSKIEDYNDFLYTLGCLTYWDVNILPKIIYDYIDENLYTNYIYNEEYEGFINSKYFEMINNYRKSKFRLCRIACGNFHSVAIRNDGTLACWGDNSKHQLDGIPEGKFIHVACGDYHSIAIREDGILVSWGDNSYHQLDNIPEGKFSHVACGLFNSLFIREDGTLLMWDNGNIKDEFLIVPQGKFTASARGDFYSIAIRQNGTLIKWSGSELIKSYEGKVKSVSCNRKRLEIIKEDGTLVSSDDNNKFIEVACGTFHSAAIKEDGTLSAWGKNNRHQLDGIPEGIFINF